MHPILFEIPLPHWQLPLLTLLAVGATLGALVALLGWRARALDVTILGVTGALLSLLFAFRARGETFAMTDLPIYGYGALLATAFTLGWVVSVGLAVRSGIPRAAAAKAFFATGISALLGSRVLFVATNLERLDSVWAALDVQSGGLVAYGGFLGGLLGAWVYGRVSGTGLLTWADGAAPAVALGVFLTRIGCYLFGCDFGKPLNEAAPSWLRHIGTFPRWDLPSLPLGTGAPAWQWHVERGWVDFDATESLPVHPTQLYESCVGLVLFVALLLVWRRRRFNGQVLLTLGATYGFSRFVLEAWRDDPERGAMGPVWPPELGLASALLLLGVSAALGPLRQVPYRGWRRFAQGLALLASPAGYWLARPETGATVLGAQWSTSQWLGLLTALASCIAWSRLSQPGNAVTRLDEDRWKPGVPAVVTKSAGEGASSNTAVDRSESTEPESVTQTPPRPSS